MLYLSDTVEAVLKEVPNRPIWIQRFLLPLAGLKIAGIAELPNDHPIHWALFYSETLKRDPTCAESDPGDYLISQVLVEPIQDEFDGMLVRGAEGKYRNLVIFKPEGVWQEWTDGDLWLVTSP